MYTASIPPDVLLDENRTSVLLVYQPIFCKKPYWQIVDKEIKDMMNGGSITLEVGEAVYAYINKVLPIDDKYLYKDVPKWFAKHQSKEKDKWYESARELLEIIESRDSYTRKELLSLYKKYSTFAFFFTINDFEAFESGYLGYPNIDKEITFMREITAENKDTGIEEVYKVFNAHSTEYFFAMDLFQLLLNPDVKFIAHACENCKRIYYPHARNSKYCAHCRDDAAVYKGIQNKKAKNDEAQSLYKKITQMLSRRNANSNIEETEKDDLLTRFKDEFKYHKARIQGKDVTNTNQYPNIDSMEDLVAWLKAKHDEYKASRKRAKVIDHGIDREKNQQKDR